LAPGTRQRTKLLAGVARTLSGLLADQVLRVAIDGLDGAGKTVFADELAAQLEARQLSVIRASTDSFHNPRHIRYRLGRRSPEGYFLDSFNLTKLKELLLEPLSPGGSGWYCTEHFDHRTDAIVPASLKSVSRPAILLFDGIFLHRPELLPYWDHSIFLDVSRRESLRRCCVREGGGSPHPEAPENARYVLGQQLYFDRCSPKARASVVIDNEDTESPYITSPS
jgi:uridine kinase